MSELALGTVIFSEGPFKISDEECHARSDNELMDLIEGWLHEQPESKFVDAPLVHRFVPHAYVREITMKAGTIVASRIHKTQHVFIISKGCVSVWTLQDGVRRLCAPYTGITQPGTRRLLFIHEDTVWTTFHPTDLQSVPEIEKDILLPHPEPVALDDKERESIKNFVTQWRSILAPEPTVIEEQSNAPSPAAAGQA